MPQADASVSEHLGRIIRGHPHHRHAARQRAKEQFLEHVVPAHEAAEDGHTRPGHVPWKWGTDDLERWFSAGGEAGLYIHDWCFLLRAPVGGYREGVTR